jgi:hypothetical protein
MVRPKTTTPMRKQHPQASPWSAQARFSPRPKTKTPANRRRVDEETGRRLEPPSQKAPRRRWRNIYHQPPPQQPPQLYRSGTKMVGSEGGRPAAATEAATPATTGRWRRATPSTTTGQIWPTACSHKAAPLPCRQGIDARAPPARGCRRAASWLAQPKQPPWPP